MLVNNAILQERWRLLRASPSQQQKSSGHYKKRCSNKCMSIGFKPLRTSRHSRSNPVGRLLRRPGTPHEKEILHRESESTDQTNDALVYELYGLTEPEIRIVEGG